MAFGTITVTESTFGSISGSIVGAVPGTLSGSVGVPGPQGPAGSPGAVGPQGPVGPAGPGVPAGGSAGQFLQKTSGVSYETDWVTVNLAAYAVKANNLSDLPSAPDARTNLGLGTMATASASNYSTTAVADTLYSPIAAGLPTGGTVGQVLTKNSGTNFDASFATLIPGDRYVTTSASSLSISNGSKSLTVGTGLAYTPLQDVTIALTSDPTLHHMHGPVTSYNSSTGALVVDVQNHTGSGTFTGWTVNVGGVVPLETVEWGEVLGTLGDQTDLATALNAKLELSGGVLTVNSTIQASTATTSSLFAGDVFGVELSANPSENSSLQYNGLLVQNAIGTMSVTPSGLTFPNSSTQTVAYPGTAGFLLKADNLSGLANTGTARTNLGLGTIATVNDAPSDGSTYGRNNGAWVVAGGGSSPADALTTDEVNAIANASIPNYAAGTSSTLSYGGGLFTFNYPNPDPAVAGGYVSFISDSSYSFTIPSGSIANWEVRYPSGTGDTIANLVSWFNSNYPGVGAIAYAGDDTQSIDSLGGLSSSAFVFQQNTVGSSDTFLISGYIKDYLDKMFFNTSGWQSMLVPVLGVGFPGVSKFLDLSTTFRQVTDNTFGTRIFANGAITSPLVNLPHGLAPGGPVNGDLWTTSSGLFVRINGATQTLGPGTDYRAYTTAGSTTWTKPAGAKWVEIIMFGGGGGGGSGGRFATTSIRTGAGGGAGGPILIAKVAASALGATETVVVGAGGTGGPSTTTDTTIGTGGNQGGSSSFSIFTAAGGGGGAGGGNIGTAPGGLATVGWVTGVTGASSTAGGTAPATNTAGASGGAAGVNSFVATGGGAGSGNIANTTTSNNGGTGGQKNASNTTSGTPLILGGTAGTTAGVAPTTGVAGGGLRGGGTGGGGGAYRTAQAGMAGAVGASPGGGGGGGSASDNGFASGAGGAGGVGAVYIITYC